ncbi:unnamed protein product [Heterosigma akashiwo]|uniref:Translation initiation factor IF2/IF5 domain-containing protein n=2 Tax=Heterosigma akashiwo TaxID=2829 RepID=A0A6V1N6Q0_HETAK|eukprot:CAMPEP_0204347366 /NCGR_PEP_ID=MMETSP0469-20131031/27891_1 /ASSEMBLY_ACC=CAM_ASM_000384 /TAXON_ID=2969 /ORGANISM="Oxyrrhis marina" /LENGTH=238 /DNA_ID=CAMNT_0051333161 /DNA_START=116 /DNA_END=832 /DNA_ORIENTATION=-
MTLKIIAPQNFGMEEEAPLPTPPQDSGSAPEPQPEGAAADEVAAMFDLSKKKKKKKKKKKDDDEQGDDAPSAASSGSKCTYTYDELLERINDILHDKNPELSEKRRQTIKPPQMMRIGTRKTVWTNFQEICKSMKRNPEHVFQFVVSELGTEGSIDGKQQLVLRGRLYPKYIESLLRKYIVEYVTCQMCRAANTTLTRDQVSRLFFVHCQDCGSSRCVAQIRAGFHAQTRAERRALRK